MSDHMTAAEWRIQTGADAEEPDNPYLDYVVSQKIKEGSFDGLTYKKTGKSKIVGIPVPLEHEIQSAILKALSYMRPGFFWRQNSGSFNVGTESAPRYFRAGLKGISDILGVYKGIFVAIEVKRPGEKPTIYQIAFIEAIKAAGGIAFICDDAEAVRYQLTKEYTDLLK